MDIMHGGGILIGVRKNIQFFFISISNIPVKHLIVHFSNNYLSYIICGVYFPPLTDTTIFNAHLSIVDQVILRYPEVIFIFWGDYNLPHIFWSNDINSLLYSSIFSYCGFGVSENFAFHEYFQINNLYNTHNSLLDTNSHFISVETALEIAIPPDAFCPFLCFSFLSVIFRNTLTNPQIFRNFNKANYFGFIEFFNLPPIKLSKNYLTP